MERKHGLDSQKKTFFEPYHYKSNSKPRKSLELTRLWTSKSRSSFQKEKKSQKTINQHLPKGGFNVFLKVLQKAPLGCWKNTASSRAPLSLVRRSMSFSWLSPKSERAVGVAFRCWVTVGYCWLVGWLVGCFLFFFFFGGGLKGGLDCGLSFFNDFCGCLSGSWWRWEDLYNGFCCWRCLYSGIT